MKWPYSDPKLGINTPTPSLVWEQRSRVQIPEFITEKGPMLGVSGGSRIAAGEHTEASLPAPILDMGWQRIRHSFYFGKNVKYALVPRLSFKSNTLGQTVNSQLYSLKPSFHWDVHYFYVW